MTGEPTLETWAEKWAQIRYEYERTDRPVEDICAKHNISSGTLRDRMRRWNWTRRRLPIPDEGPPAALPPTIDHAAPFLPTAPEIAPFLDSSPACPPSQSGIGEGGTEGSDAGTPGEDDSAESVPRLQNAVARVLPAIEATVAKLGAQPMHPREMERAARVLAALTRTLRELNALLRQCPVPDAHVADDGDDAMPENIDEFRHALARRIEAWAANRMGDAGEAAPPQDT